MLDEEYVDDDDEGMEGEDGVMETERAAARIQAIFRGRQGRRRAGKKKTT